MPAKLKLDDRTCTPCTSRTKRVPDDRARRLLAEIPGWTLARGVRLRRTVRFEDFTTLMAFVNDLAVLAEEQAHHPDFRVRYSRLDLELSTHAIDGLSDNDFILAAKINGLLGERG